MKRTGPRWHRLILLLIGLGALAFSLHVLFRSPPPPPAPAAPAAPPAVNLQKDVRIPMPDGAYLSADLYLPRGKATFPAILARLPYGKEDPGFLKMVAEALAARGVAFVIQDCRGRYRSTGNFAPFINEVSDGAQTVRWIRRQTWCNGRIGLIGFSYLGYTAWAAAVGTPEGVDFLVPITTTVTPYRMVYERGVLNYLLALDWTSTIEGQVNQPTEAFDWFKPRNTPLIQVDDQINKDLPLFNRWVRHPQPDAFWSAGDLLHQLPTVDAPVLFVGGWYDIFTKDTLSDFADAMKVGGEKMRASRLVMGPWSHSLRRQTGQVDFGQIAGFHVIAKAMFSWIDHHLDLAMMPPKLLPRVSIFVMGENRWRGEEAWPLERTRYTDYYLHSDGGANTVKGDGRLTVKPPGDEPPDAFVFDPSKPVPTVGGCVYPPEHAGPKDQGAVEQRADVLVYTSAPLDQPLEVTGPVKVTLFAASSARDTDFTAKLVAVMPDGRTQNLQDGIIRARFRHSVTEPQMLTEGKVEKYTIDLWATSYLFAAGQRIRLEISSSNFPRFDVNRNTGNDPANDSVQVVARQKVFHETSHPSFVTLPVIPR